MNDDIKKYPVYALSNQGLVPIEITSTNDYNHMTHQLHHFIKQQSYNGNKDWYDNKGIEQKLILLPNFVHEQVHQQAIKNLTDEEFEEKFKISRWELIFNRRHSNYD
jgi:hypothetical protein